MTLDILINKELFVFCTTVGVNAPCGNETSSNHDSSSPCVKISQVRDVDISEGILEVFHGII